jgi:hypothetical protein
MADSSTAPEDAEADGETAAVEKRYDFDEFGPEQMQEMSAEEWEAAFDPDSWITGDRLLDRVTGELRARVATRDVFAVVEEVFEDGDRRVIAYDDDGYALVYPDGTVEGFGTVLRDVKPTVALCSMESYDPGDPPEDGALLPEPDEVPQQSGEFGNLMIQVVAAMFVLSGLALVVAWPLTSVPVLGAALGLFILLPIGVFLFLTVANARLSDRFRAEEYRERLRAIGLEDGERPAFLPLDGDQVVELPEAAPPEAEEAEDPTPARADAPGTVGVAPDATTDAERADDDQ